MFDINMWLRNLFTNDKKDWVADWISEINRKNEFNFITKLVFLMIYLYRIESYLPPDLTLLPKKSYISFIWYIEYVIQIMWIGFFLFWIPVNVSRTRPLPIQSVEYLRYKQRSASPGSFSQVHVLILFVWTKRCTKNF